MLIVLDQCAFNVQNVWHFVLKKKKQQFVATMGKLRINMLVIPLSIHCSMSFLWAIHLSLEDSLNPLENIIKRLHLQVCVVSFKVVKPRAEGSTLSVETKSYHIGNLKPEVNHGARFVQIYFLDDDLQTERCMEIFDDLNRNTINNIQEVLESINALVRGFKSSQDVLLGGHNMGLRISGEASIGEYRPSIQSTRSSRNCCCCS